MPADLEDEPTGGTATPTERSYFFDRAGNIVRGLSMAELGAQLTDVTQLDGAEIKALYEAETDTNAFNDAALNKLSSIEAGADVTPTADFATAAQGELADTAVQPGDPDITSIVPFGSLDLTLNLTHVNSLIRCTFSSSGTVTIGVPNEDEHEFPIGSRINIIAAGTAPVEIYGKANFSPTVTVNATPSLVLRAQWSGCTLIKVNTNEWDAFGDFAT